MSPADYPGDAQRRPRRLWLISAACSLLMIIAGIASAISGHNTAFSVIFMALGLFNFVLALVNWSRLRPQKFR